ncbi:FAD-dependent oxidoreductase [Patescibacteria group bacterium]|nr:FAD-dependent oxidoreductase [Patescibacteria group bacterium]
MEEKPIFPEHKIFFLGRRHEYADVYTYVFRPEEPILYTAGQYCHLRVSGMPEGVRAVREYSFATAPHEAHIEFGIDFRSGSDYQKRLQALQVGDPVTLFKIKNHITWPPRFPSLSSTLGNPSGVVHEPPPPKEKEAVMIAGGVGITPFRSMLRDKREKNIALRTTVIHVGTHGFLYENEIKELADDYIQMNREDFNDSLASLARPGAHHYVAGSPAFVSHALDVLSARGVTAESDPFKGLEEI